MNIDELSAEGLGRIFVVGDVAGHFSVLNNLVNHFDLDPLVDKIILNGNFLGFAPSSRQVLPWLEKNWVVPLLGPNEAGVLSQLKGENSPTLSGQWLKFLSKQDRNRLEGILEGLPVALECVISGQPIVVSHFAVPLDVAWPDLAQSIRGWDKSSSAVFSIFDSRLAALGLSGNSEQILVKNRKDNPISVSSVAVENPDFPVICIGNRIFLAGSAHMHHGDRYANKCLLPFIELKSIANNNIGEIQWQGNLDISSKSLRMTNSFLKRL